jgi:UDP-N-acetylglucosamine 2-epimerase (non-hydrolysing)
MSERIDSLEAASRLKLPHGGYLVVTLHRPSLVDGPLLYEAMTALQQVAERMPVVFPVHPRTRAELDASGWSSAHNQLRLLEPIGYLEFLSLVKTSAGVITDSGGIQEETTFLGIPCFTLRSTTERPVTCTMGTNQLLGLEPQRILEVPGLLGQGRLRGGRVPERWDGMAARRIVEVLARAELPLTPAAV